MTQLSAVDLIAARGLLHHGSERAPEDVDERGQVSAAAAAAAAARLGRRRHTHLTRHVDACVDLQVESEQVFERERAGRCLGRRDLDELGEQVLEVGGGERECVAHRYAAYVVEDGGELIGPRRGEQNAELIVGLAEIGHQLDGVQVVVVRLAEVARVARHVAEVREHVLANVEHLLLVGVVVAVACFRLLLLLLLAMWWWWRVHGVEERRKRVVEGHEARPRVTRRIVRLLAQLVLGDEVLEQLDVEAARGLEERRQVRLSLVLLLTSGSAGGCCLFVAVAVVRSGVLAYARLKVADLQLEDHVPQVLLERLVDGEVDVGENDLTIQVLQRLPLRPQLGPIAVRHRHGALDRLDPLVQLAHMLAGGFRIFRHSLCVVVVVVAGGGGWFSCAFFSSLAFDFYSLLTQQ